MKRVKEDKLKFYVLLCDINTGEPYMFNIFDNTRIREDIMMCLKSDPSREELKKRLNSVCMNQLWSRCEYEILVTRHWDNGPVMVDAYFQVAANLDIIVDYLLKECIK